MTTDSPPLSGPPPGAGTTPFLQAPPVEGEPREYRSGYREGFHDGYDEAAQRHDEGAAKDDPKKRDGGNEKDEKAGTDQKEGEDDQGGGKDGRKEKKPLYQRPLVVLAVFVVLLVLIIAAIVFWRHSQHHESTDDAFIDGRASRMAAQVGGRVIALHVVDNQIVHAGDPLLDIDPRDVDARLAQARAELATAEGQLGQALAAVRTQRANAGQAGASTRQAEADFGKAANDRQRFRAVNPEAVSRQQVDAAESSASAAAARVDAGRSGERAANAQIEAAQAQVRSAEASIETARADLAAAELQRSYTHVVAPVAGRVTRRSVELGNVVSVGQALLSIVQPELWVTANYKETQLTRMRLGQRVEIRVDAFPELEFHGHVESFQTGTGAYFSLLPAENATGNYVKVVQRVPVKIVFDDDRVGQYPIGPGMSVVPSVTIP